MNSLKSPNGNLREHLHTQGRTRAQNQALEPGPAGALGNHQRGGSLNIQDLYSHYQKGPGGSGPSPAPNGRNVTYYSNKHSQQTPHQQFQSLEPNSAHNPQNYAKSPNGGGANQNNNIFVPGSMRFAVMNR